MDRKKGEKMSWYRDDDGKIITDEEFENGCCNCSAFCSEGTITVPCNGERTDCSYFKEVDTSEYDKAIREKVIDEFAEKVKPIIDEKIKGWTNCDYLIIWCARAVDEIADQMKVGAE